jgi:hypothetical protein
MSARERIKQIAIQITIDFKEQTLGLIPELEKIKRREAAIKAQLDAANLCDDRLSNFQSDNGRDFFCPRCWVQSGKQSKLTTIPSETDEDSLRCRTCNSKFSV